ncbi:hypothetical protein TSUD_171570 [Trifolium subterraneum]|uniref:Uncharacterized protein n=1 Tax=Trifolium subterraneum TaxID=3900 RepID=A0A2Z6M6V0_TRISU|nr:hypothetical protein TSUD_171570 [Trifolium subterraneum]
MWCYTSNGMQQWFNDLIRKLCAARCSVDISASWCSIHCCQYLWEVIDRDINLFSETMFDAWLKERSEVAMQCLQCKLLSEESEEAMNMKVGEATVCYGVPTRISRKNEII